MSFTVAQAARLYGIEVAAEYDEPLLGDRRRGVLVCSGAGLMMAIMDAAPLRWCVETDTQPKGCDLPSFMEMVAGIAPPLAVAGWFSLSNPETLRAGIARVDPARRVVYSGAGLAVLSADQHGELEGFVKGVGLACASR